MPADPFDRGAQSLLHLAVPLHRQGRIAEAESLYCELLAVEPFNDPARHLLGLIRYNQGRYAEALELIRPVALGNPRDLQAHANLGNVLKSLGRFEEALESYDRALAVDANNDDVMNNRGIVLADLRRFEEALESYDKVLIRNPRHAEALFNRGLALWQLHRPREALASYDADIALRPGHAQAWNNRGNVLRQLDQPVEALKSYERASVLDPENAYALGNIAFLAQYICDWEKVEKVRTDMYRRIQAGTSVVSPFVLLGYSSDPALQLQCAKVYGRDRLRVRPDPLWQGQHYRHDRICVAYMSSDFRQHPMSYLIAGMLEQHDRRTFEIIGISIGGNDGSDIRQRVAKACDRFEDVWGLSDREVAHLLYSMEIDILVDLNGYTEGGRPEILTYRPAPIQVNYLGYPATTGSDFVDFVIADRTVLPPEEQAFFTEQIAYLPDSYLANDSKREVSNRTPSRAEEGLPESGFVFCCFGNSWKIAAAVFDIWMRLLQAIPGSVLWLIDSNEYATDRLKLEAAARGVNSERLVFGRRIRPQDHLARHRLADLALDTLPYNGHTTACDALWMGVPLVTCRGASFAGRVAASALAAVGLPELIAETPDQYESLATTFARDDGFRKLLCGKLKQNLAAQPLFDTPAFCRHMEAVYLQMRDLAVSGFTRQHNL